MLPLAAALASLVASGAEPEATAPQKAWSNETELNVVFTEGNSNTESLGLKHTLVRRFSGARFQARFEAFRATTSDDWFLQVDPGYTWEPGADPPTDPASTLVKPAAEPDAENYFVEGRYDHEIGKTFQWHVGGSWDSNEDAGILSRYIAFGGVGHLWRDRPELRLQTSYGLSWTAREEETPDPEKDERFLGARLGLQYRQKFGQTTTLDNDTTVNVSLADRNDWSAEMTNSVSVSMTKRLSLRVSLRWLYNHEPALEDVDVNARVVIRDPDGIPGNGDEYIETVAEGGSEFEFDESRVRMESLDQIFKTTLVLSF
jgi:putative salt-induced outer membrane protein YdiY